MANVLIHYGTPGMRWGIRHTPKQLEKMRGIVDSSKNITNEVKTHVGKPRPSSSSVKSMSDQELREKVSRLNLEKQYSTLTADNVSKGRKFAMKTLEISGSVLTVAGSVLTIAQLIKQMND